ncbi:MAG: GntR family transcriptional regulator, partial [Pseudomonadales bacterium]|nr:GntR family transcriptional regulator [Pseudomonadales bacterium]
MQFNINRKLPVSIKEQLKGQIRGMINSELLLPGQSLPSCKDMSAILSINRNTVSAAYLELSAEGVLTTNRGAGTMVSKKTNTKPVNPLDDLMNETFVRARKMGFSSEEIFDQFFSTLSFHSAEARKTVLMVWCNHETIREVGEALESKLGVTIRSLLVEEVQKFPEKAEKALSGVDLVVTSLNYIEAILPLAEKQGVDVAGLILTPVSRVLNEVVRLPKGTTVGFACVNNLAAKSTCKGVRLSGGMVLKTIWAGADDAARVKKMVSNCDVIFATHHVYDQ